MGNKFEHGDAVRREIDICKPELGYKYGYIVEVYSKPYNYRLRLGPYPERFSPPRT